MENGSGWGRHSSLMVVVCACGLAVGAAAADRGTLLDASNPEFFFASPLFVELAALDASYTNVTITDVEVADVTGDGRRDILAAWYADDWADPTRSLRRLTVLQNVGNGFTTLVEFDLYQYRADVESLSIFRWGTGDVGVGDFDGDGDLDFAVAAFFADELWLIENLGDGTFQPYLRFPFGVNSMANNITPPELLAADFDQDGRDELVYVSDPLLRVDSYIVHFWHTDGSIADMQRVYWDQIWSGPAMYWTRSLAVGDFDGVGGPDLALAGSLSQYQSEPVLCLWTNLNLITGWFDVQTATPTFICSDVETLPPSTPGGRVRLALAARDGKTVQIWAAASLRSGLAYQPVATTSGFAGYSSSRGMSLAIGDLNGDQLPDIVTKQKLGLPWYGLQVEIALDADAATWVRTVPDPISSLGLREPDNANLFPHNLAVGDVLGNRLSEIVAGFSAEEILPSLRYDDETAWLLKVAIWQNGCVGDVNLDGVTNCADRAAVLSHVGICADSAAYDANLDLDHDGCITTADVSDVIADMGCLCGTDGGEVRGDCNCDCTVDLFDIDAFVVAIQGTSAYAKRYPHCRWLNADVNGDGRVNMFDIDGMVTLLTGD